MNIAKIASNDRESQRVGRRDRQKRDVRLKLLDRAAKRIPTVGLLYRHETPVFFVNAPDLVRRLLVTHALDFEKSEFQRLALGGGERLGAGLGYSLLTSSNEDHATQMKQFGAAFDGRRAAGFVRSIASCADELVRAWLVQREVDVCRDIMRLCLKVIGLALLSTDFGSSVETMLDAVLHFSRYAGTSVTERKGADVDAQTRDYEDAFLACLATVVEERRRASGGHDDALAMLLAHEPAEERDRALGPYLRDHLTTLIVTGSENPKNALSWAIHLLMKHPDVFAKVRDEVRSVVRGDVVSFDDLPRLRYTAQVFKEVLRLYPPAYAFGRRAVRDVQLGDVLIPAGAEVLVSPYALHRRADSFPNPERFDPERFSEKEEAKRPRGAYLPFGVGPRACIGGQLATLTGHTVLATLALRVSLERVSQDDVQPEPRATLRPATPIFAIASRVTS